MNLLDIIAGLQGGRQQQPPQPGFDTGLPPPQQPQQMQPQQNNAMGHQSVFDNMMRAVGQPQQPQQGGGGGHGGLLKLLSMFAGG